MKHFAVLLAFLLTVGTPATSADTVCALSSSVTSSTSDDPDKLIIRRNDLNIKAILMTKYFTQVYNCTDAIVDEYECYRIEIMQARLKHTRCQQAPTHEVPTLITWISVRCGWLAALL